MRNRNLFMWAKQIGMNGTEYMRDICTECFVNGY